MMESKHFFMKIRNKVPEEVYWEQKWRRKNRKLKNINNYCREKLKKKKSRNGCKWKVKKMPTLKKGEKRIENRNKIKQYKLRKFRYCERKVKKLAEVVVRKLTKRFVPQNRCWRVKNNNGGKDEAIKETSWSLDEKWTMYNKTIWR